MTKNEINKIQSEAYKLWAQTESAKELLKTPHNMFMVCEVSEVGKTTKIITYTQKSQINSISLAEKGFTENCVVEQLFITNRQTKCLYCESVVYAKS